MDILSVIGQLAVVFFLIFMNGFFVAAEFACVKIRASRVDTLVAEGNGRAKYVKELIEHLDASLSVTQLGITLASLALGWVGEPFVATLILPVTRFFGLDDVLGHTISVIVGFSIITAMHIILGELTPKSMAIQDVEKIALFVALPLLLFGKIMRPFVWLLNTLANSVIHFLGFRGATESDEAHTEEEIRLLVEESHRQGLIDDTEVDFVDNVFDFTELTVREIMVPRTDMVCIYLGDPFEKNLAVIMEEQLTRYPICREDKDHIIGFLHVKDLLPYLSAGKRPILRKLRRKALVVPESMDVSVLLKTMQEEKSQLAVVVDEYGGTAGMVTIEDIVEEIVGDIQDEFDEERPMAEYRGNNVYSVDAKMLLEELDDMLGITIEEDDVDSVGGWLNDALGGDARVGQMTAFLGNRFFVEELDGARITRVLIAVENDDNREEEQ